MKIENIEEKILANLRNIGKRAHEQGVESHYLMAKECMEWMNNLQPYTGEDIQEFAEWCGFNGWRCHNIETHTWFNINSFEEKTTSQLKDMWEIETGRRKP